MSVFHIRLSKARLWGAAYVSLQIIYFAYNFQMFNNDLLYKSFRKSAGFGLPIARASAACISLAAGIILLPVCRNLITIFRQSIIGRILPFDSNIKFHRLLGYSIVLFSALHIGAHTNNLRHVSDNPLATLWTHGTMLTGIALTFILVLMVTASISKVKKPLFEIFFYVHHLYIVWFLMLVMHGSFCFIKSDGPKQCAGPKFWMYLIFAGSLFIIEKVVKELSTRKPTQLYKVIGHPSKVIELQVKKKGFKMLAGQYVFICLPELAIYQWHPFTLTSAPEEDFLSVHIRCVGDWTESLAERLGCRWDKKGQVLAMQTTIGRAAKHALPLIRVEGPFGAASEDVFNFETVACFGAGIGVTPFASILKHIWYKFKTDPKMKLKKVYFYWTCRDKAAFEWFQDLLAMLESDPQFSNFIIIQIYLTGPLNADEHENILINDGGGFDPITRLKAKTNYGRPVIDNIFSEMRRNHLRSTVGVFFCGPKAMDKLLEKACKDFSSTGTVFDYKKENF